MLFATSITTSAGTVKASAKSSQMLIGRGLIYRVEIDFPPGSLGLLHIQVFDGSYQLYPTTPEESINGDDRLISFEDMYLKLEPPWELKVLTWNLDESYDHSLNLRIGVAETEAFMSRFMPSIGWEKFSRVMEETQVVQQQERAKQITQSIKRVGG